MGDRWEGELYPLWHTSAPMSWVVNSVVPDDLFVKGEGSWLIDRSGRRFLDARAGSGVMALGYSRRDIADAIYRQALELPFVSTMRYARAAPVVVDYASALAASAPNGLRHVRFTHTGSSAVEDALLLARRYFRNLERPGKTHVVALHTSYHGNSLMTMAASGQPMMHEAFAPMPHGFRHVPPPDTAACGACHGDSTRPSSCIDDISRTVEDLGDDQVAAIVVEPVLGLAGLPLTAHFLKELRTLCSQYEILLVFDEVFTGFARTGPMFATEASGVVPDVMCLSKGMTAGYAPLAAVLTSDAVYEAFDAPRMFLAHGSTMDGHPLACAAGIATLEAYRREQIVTSAGRLGERLLSALSDEFRNSPMVASVRGVGPLLFLDLVDSAGNRASMATMREVQVACERRDVLIDFTPDVLMVVPPLTLTDSEVNILVAALAESVSEVAGRTPFA